MEKNKKYSKKTKECAHYIERLEAIELVGFCIILGVDIVDTEDNEKMKSINALIAGALDKFDTLERSKQRELLKIVRMAAKKVKE